VTYKIKNGTFDIGTAVMWYPLVVDYQWKLVQKLYTDDIFIGSYMMEMSVFGYRKKSKSILKP